MNMSKQIILESMHNLLCYNVIGHVQYTRRYDGFNGELCFSSLCKRKSWKTVAGGFFIPLEATSDPFKSAIYVLACPTGMNKEQEKFINQQLQRAATVATRGVFLVRYDAKEQPKTWSIFHVPSPTGDVEIKYPSTLTITHYNSDNHSLAGVSFDSFKKITGLNPFFKKKAEIPADTKNHYLNKLSIHNEKDLTELYVSRFVLDALCTFGKVQRGAPLDVDVFLRGKGKLVIIEVKEKNPSRNNCFGMDTRRIKSLKKLEKIFAAEASYVVRQIANQDSREFVGWKWINMGEFDRKASRHEVQGGHGMRHDGTDNPTRMCHVKNFKSLI